MSKLGRFRIQPAPVRDRRPQILHLPNIGPAHVETPEERRRYVARSKAFELALLSFLVAVGIFAAFFTHWRTP